MELQRIATKHLHTPNTEQMSKIGGMATAALKKEAKKAEISWLCLLAVFGVWWPCCAPLLLFTRTRIRARPQPAQCAWKLELETI